MDDTIPITVHIGTETHATLIRAASDMGLPLSEYLVRILEVTAHDHVEIEQVIDGFRPNDT